MDLSFHWEYTLGKILHPFFISNAPPPPLEVGDVSFFNETMFQKLQNIVQMMHLSMYIANPNDYLSKEHWVICGF